MRNRSKTSDFLQKHPKNTVFRKPPRPKLPKISTFSKSVCFVLVFYDVFLENPCFSVFRVSFAMGFWFYLFFVSFHMVFPFRFFSNVKNRVARKNTPGITFFSRKPNFWSIFSVFCEFSGAFPGFRPKWSGNRHPAKGNVCFFTIFIKKPEKRGVFFVQKTCFFPTQTVIFSLFATIFYNFFWVFVRGYLTAFHEKGQKTPPQTPKNSTFCVKFVFVGGSVLQFFQKMTIFIKTRFCDFWRKRSIFG